MLITLLLVSWRGLAFFSMSCTIQHTRGRSKSKFLFLLTQISPGQLSHRFGILGMSLPIYGSQASSRRLRLVYGTTTSLGEDSFGGRVRLNDMGWINQENGINRQVDFTSFSCMERSQWWTERKGNRGGKKRLTSWTASLRSSSWALDTVRTCSTRSK